MQVCEDWFARMRMLLLRTSAAANNHALTLHHAYARLGDLKSQLRHLKAAAAAEEAQLKQAEKQLAKKEKEEREEAARQQAAAETQLDAAQNSPLQADPASAESFLHPQARRSSLPQSMTAATNATKQAPVSEPTGVLKQTIQPAAKSLLEIQAEQAAESAQAAAAKAAASSPSRSRNRAAKTSSTVTPAQKPFADKSQAKVLQVKRPKPGQPPASNSAPGSLKVVPLTRNAAGKVAVAESVPMPGKIKLMARPQVQDELPHHTMWYV